MSANRDEPLDGGLDAVPDKKPRGQRSHPQRRALQSERSRRDILDAASRVIAQYGFREATVDLISEAAGISATSIYWHFGNREGMLAALAVRITDRYNDAVTAELDLVLPRPRDPATFSAEQVETYIRVYTRAMSQFALDHSEVVRTQTALSSEGVMLPGMRGGVRDYTRRMRTPTIDTVERGVVLRTLRPLTGKTWVDFVIGSLMGASIQIRMHWEGFDPVPPVRAVHDAALLVLGLTPKGDELRPFLAAAETKGE